MLRFHAVILPDGAPEKLGIGDEAGSEEDIYEELRNSGHRFPHPGGAGEQLAINEEQSPETGIKPQAPQV
ncbi:uncharacterized protein LOC113649776 isoform X1 [Tachysurus ichikawai]